MFPHWLLYDLGPWHLARSQLGSGADTCMDQFNCSRDRVNMGGRGKECIPSGEDVYMYVGAFTDFKLF